MSDVRLFCYKMTADTGFAPNPFGGSLTLATCKPGIRRTKREDNWIAGFTSKKLCGHPIGEEKMIYLMQIAKKLPIAIYFRDPSFKSEIPDPYSSRCVKTCGDNIYRPLSENPRSPSDYNQLPNPNHRDDAREHDIGGHNVLVASRFAYFGREALVIPPDLRPAIPRGQSAYGSVTDGSQAQAFIDYVLTKAGVRKVLGAPHKWPADDVSWWEAP